MISINDRLEKYEKDITSTMNGYIYAVERELDPKKIKNYRFHINKINEIKKFGAKDYIALNALTNINYFAENKNNLPTAVYDIYMRYFGIEETDELYETLKLESDVEKVRNTIWHDCFGMKYDLITKYESVIKQDEIRANESLTQSEKLELLYQIECISGYWNGENHNPTYTTGLDNLRIALDKINKSQTKIFK